MKNLIGLFFVLSLSTSFSQTTIKKEIKPESIAEVNYEITPEKDIIIADSGLEKTEEKATGVIKTDILKGFSSGNAALIAEYFPANIDISILGKSNLYSKSQAKQVLSTFFAQNKPTTFTVIHEGKSNGTKYFIGSYVSNEDKYRVTINVKSDKKVERIASISIER